MISMVRNMVDDDDFRAGWREYLGFAIASETREIEIWNFLDYVFNKSPSYEYALSSVFLEVILFMSALIFRQFAEAKVF